MLFDIRPKEERKDLYDRDKEIDEIRQSIERGVWIAVYGIRRVGKTSVVNVAVNDPNYIVIKINLMRMYNPRRKVYARSQFMGVFLEGINNAIKKYTLGGRAIRYISNILGTDEKSSIELNAVRIKTRLKKFREEDVSSVVREIDQLAKDNRKKLVLVFDEAQELMRVNGINSSSVFHDIYDYCKSTTVVFTGSMVGLVEKMLKELEYQKPFFGRYIRKIRVERFELNKSKDFLMRGFEEEGIKVGEDILVEAVRRFDGVPGWLTFFGAEYSFRAKHGDSPDLNEIERMAIEQVKSEFKDFLTSTQSPERYSAILISLDRLGGRGELRDVTKVVNALLGEVPEPRVHEILNRLVNLGFLRKEGQEYLLPEDEPDRKGLVEASKELSKGGY